MNTVIIMGRSISAHLAAAYLSLKQTDLRIIVVGPETNNLPVVGESLVEFSTYFFHEIGLSGYLQENHFHKIGLSFLFKERLDDPESRVYAVHEARQAPAMPSYLINRFTLTEKLEELCRDRGVQFVPGKVASIQLAEAGPHSLEIVTPDGGSRHLSADWLIDATGRRRLLAKQLGLHRDAPIQRSSFWFRLRNYDRDFLRGVDAVKQDQYIFDSHFATQHFSGRGNWVWCIPIRAADGSRLISVGITWRPDLLKDRIRNIDDFLRQVEAEHPVVADLVRSGEVVDTSIYNSYMYETTQLYSEQGWFLIGDAGDSVDPLYSTGITLTSLQIMQVASIIERQKVGLVTQGYISTLQEHYKAARNVLQGEVGRQYEVMHDPYQFQWHVHLITVFYFFALLPSWLCGYHTDQLGARIYTKLIQLGQRDYESLVRLVRKASSKLGQVRASKIPNLYPRSVNWQLTGPQELRLGLHLSRMMLRLAAFRWQVLKDARFSGWPLHLFTIVGDCLRAFVLWAAFGRSSLRSSRVLSAILHTPRSSWQQLQLPQNGEAPAPMMEVTAPVLLKTGEPSYGLLEAKLRRVAQDGSRVCLEICAHSRHLSVGGRVTMLLENQRAEAVLVSRTSHGGKHWLEATVEVSTARATVASLLQPQSDVPALADYRRHAA